MFLGGIQNILQGYCCQDNFSSKPSGNKQAKNQGSANSKHYQRAHCQTMQSKTSHFIFSHTCYSRVNKYEITFSFYCPCCEPIFHVCVLSVHTWGGLHVHVCITKSQWVSWYFPPLRPPYFRLLVCMCIYKPHACRYPQGEKSVSDPQKLEF